MKIRRTRWAVTSGRRESRGLAPLTNQHVGDVRARNRPVAVLASLLIVLGVAIVDMSPANAAGTSHKLVPVKPGSLGVVPNTTFGEGIRFQAVVNGRHECLDAANGTPGGTDTSVPAAPDVDVWGCGANDLLLGWDLTVTTSDGYGFSLYNEKTKGCLDDWDGFQFDGARVRLYGPAVVCNGVDQTWEFWGDAAGRQFLGRYSANGVFSGYVASITGPAQDGALVHMWHIANFDDQDVFEGSP